MTIQAWILLAVWIFQAGSTYAAFVVLKNQSAESLIWQKEHGKLDDKRFLLIVGMLAASVQSEQKAEFINLIKEFANQ